MHTQFITYLTILSLIFPSIHQHIHLGMQITPQHVFSLCVTFCVSELQFFNFEIVMTMIDEYYKPRLQQDYQSFTKEVNSWVDTCPSVFNGCLANRGLTSLAKEAIDVQLTSLFDEMSFLTLQYVSSILISRHVARKVLHNISDV